MGGLELPNQICTRDPRPDVAELFNGDGHTGYRLVAITGHQPDNSQFGVRFGDVGPILRRTLPNTNDAHDMLNEFAATIAATPGGSMIELGSRARSGNVYTDLFPSLSRYVGTDIMAGPNVDVVADAHTLSRSVKGQFDYAFSVSVFEHLIMPWVAAYELNKILKPGGLIYMQSHPAYPLHDEPWDFFRFCENAWIGLFNKFTGFEVLKTGYSLPASVVPQNASNGALQGLDMANTYLVSAVIARKISKPSVNWPVDPTTIADLSYSHGAGTPGSGAPATKPGLRGSRISRLFWSTRSWR